MDFKGLREKDIIFDLESGTKSTINVKYGEFGTRVGPGKELLNHESNCEAPLEEKLGFLKEELGLLEKKAGPNNSKKKGLKKPPKPPRPPKSPSLDLANQKMVQEISEMVLQKRARIERMKALKKMKNAKSTLSSGNLCAFVITVIFCVVIIWQGVFTKNRPSVTSQRALGSSVAPRGAYITVQLYKDAPIYGPHGSGSQSPKNVEQVSGLDEHIEKQSG